MPRTVFVSRHLLLWHYDRLDVFVSRTRHPLVRLKRRRAGVVELVDTPDLGSGGLGRGGSSPSARTKAVDRLLLRGGYPKMCADCLMRPALGLGQEQCKSLKRTSKA
jgi:hypothetical protein